MRIRIQDTKYFLNKFLIPWMLKHKTYVQLSDESMEVFVSELKKISAADAEGEAGVYFTAALTLKDTILNLRYRVRTIN